MSSVEATTNIVPFGLPKNKSIVFPEVQKRRDQLETGKPGGGGGDEKAENLEFTLYVWVVQGRRQCIGRVKVRLLELVSKEGKKEGV